MTRPFHAALATSAGLLLLAGEAFPCVIAPFEEMPPPPPQPVVVRPWSSPPPPVVVVPRWTPVPPPVVVRPWTPPPATVHVYAPPPPPTTIYVRPRPAPVVVSVPDPEPVAVETRVDDEGGTIDDRGEGVRASRRVVVGGGFGGLMLTGHDSSTLSTSYGVHLGVALRQASVGLRLDHSPDAVEVDGSSASYTIGGLGFGYHFNADSLIHPVVGASLELHALDPEGDDARYGFGVGARAGLEMEYPLDSGSLGIGLDVSGHRRFGSESSMPVSATALAFGGTVDYRF